MGKAAMGEGSAGVGSRPSKENRAGAGASDEASRKKHEKEEEARRKKDEARRKEEKAKREAKQAEQAKLLERIPMTSDIAGASYRLQMGDFCVPYRWDNSLPPIPADPKLIDIPFDRESFARFRYDSVNEAHAKYELLPEPDLGITIDLVDPAAYDKVPGASLSTDDAQLLSQSAFAQAVGEKRSISEVAKGLRKDVTWLRKTPLMGNNLYDSVHKHQKTNNETQHVRKEVSALAQHGLGEGIKSLAQQVEEIEQTFTDAANTSAASLKHPTDPTLTPVSVIPVLPDHDGWKNSYATYRTTTPLPAPPHPPTLTTCTCTCALYTQTPSPAPPPLAVILMRRSTSTRALQTLATRRRPSPARA